MIPSLLAGLLGLWLVWLGVLEPELVESNHWIIGATSAALLLLGLAALRSDYLKWPAVVDIAMASALLLTFLATNVLNYALIDFWMLFWAGSICGIVSWWSAFYYRGPQPTSEDEQDPASLPG